MFDLLLLLCCLVVVVVVVVVVFVFVALVFCNFFDFWLPIKNISQKFGNCKKPKNEKCRKKRTLGQEQLAQVCSQIVSFLLFVFL